jgi:hypothetical protein
MTPAKLRYIVRSALAKETMFHNSLTLEFFTKKQNQDALAFFRMSTSGEFERIFADMSMMILVNQTDRSLIYSLQLLLCGFQQTGTLWLHRLPLGVYCYFLQRNIRKVLKTAARWFLPLPK